LAVAGDETCKLEREAMSKPAVRRQSEYVALTREQFRERFGQRRDLIPGAA